MWVRRWYLRFSKNSFKSIRLNALHRDGWENRWSPIAISCVMDGVGL